MLLLISADVLLIINGVILVLHLLSSNFVFRGSWLKEKSTDNTKLALKIVTENWSLLVSSQKYAG